MCALVSLCVKDRCVISSESRQTMMILPARTSEFPYKEPQEQKRGVKENFLVNYLDNYY